MSLIEMSPVEREDLVNDLARRIITTMRTLGEIHGPSAVMVLSLLLNVSESDIKLAMGRIPFTINGSNISVRETAWEIRALGL